MRPWWLHGSRVRIERGAARRLARLVERERSACGRPAPWCAPRPTTRPSRTTSAPTGGLGHGRRGRRAASASASAIQRASSGCGGVSIGRPRGGAGEAGTARAVPLAGGRRAASPTSPIQTFTVGPGVPPDLPLRARGLSPPVGTCTPPRSCGSSRGHLEAPREVANVSHAPTNVKTRRRRPLPAPASRRRTPPGKRRRRTPPGRPRSRRCRRRAPAARSPPRSR